MAKLVTLRNICHLCEEECVFSTPQKLRQHLATQHNLTVPARKSGYRHTSNSLITYVSVPLNAQPHPGIECQYACPSCSYTSATREALKAHIEQQHLEPEDNNQDDDQDSRGSKRAKKVSITSERQIFTFTAAHQSFTPYMPKLPVDTIRKLEDLVTIISPTNGQLFATLKLQVEKQTQDQQSLAVLKEYPVAFQTLSSALDVPFKTLPNFLWTCNIPEKCSLLDEQLTDIIRHVLTSFSSKCKRPSEFIQKSERTFWTDRVQPIFQHFGDETGLLGFEWCETVSFEQVESTVNPNNWEKGGVNYVDGRGYDKKGRNRIMMESSGGAGNERIDHTVNDTIKNAHTSISALNSIIRRNPYSRFTTMSKVNTFSIQSICKSITLCVTYLDKDKPGSFIVQQLRTAEIPTSYDERMLWLKVFELMASLMTKMTDQVKVFEQLDKESSEMITIPKPELTCTVLNLSPC